MSYLILALIVTVFSVTSGQLAVREVPFKAVNCGFIHTIMKYQLTALMNCGTKLCCCEYAALESPFKTMAETDPCAQDLHQLMARLDNSCAAKINSTAEDCHFGGRRVLVAVHVERRVFVPYDTHRIGDLNARPHTYVTPGPTYHTVNPNWFLIIPLFLVPITTLLLCFHLWLKYKVNNDLKEPLNAGRQRLANIYTKV